MTYTPPTLHDVDFRDGDYLSHPGEDAEEDFDKETARRDYWESRYEAQRLKEED